MQRENNGNHFIGFGIKSTFAKYQHKTGIPSLTIEAFVSIAL